MMDLLGHTARIIVRRTVEESTDEQLAIIQQGQASTFEKVDFMRTSVEDG